MKDIFERLILLVFSLMLFTQCATVEVEQVLKHEVESKGESYTRELAAQSPFKKVEISWREASELMKERNTKYRKALLSREESLHKKGLVNNLTHELRKSLSSSVQMTLNPSEIAKAMKDPIASLPRQLESITDLKNISHSLTQTEWGRVTQGVEAEAVQREEVVNLHVLFCQGEIIESAERDLAKIKRKLSAEGEVKPNKAVDRELVKTDGVIKKEREQWLNRVRDFFNAEYHDVKLSDYKGKLNFYRGVKDPGFSDWKRWRVLANSSQVAGEMKKDHVDAKPVLPGMNMLKSNLGLTDLRAKLAEPSTLNKDMVMEVRRMLKDWRILKSVQQELAESKLAGGEAVGLPELRHVTKVYNLRKKEIEKLKNFWVIDEECWVRM